MPKAGGWQIDRKVIPIMCAADERLDKQEATTNDEQEATAATDTIEEQEVTSDEDEKA